MEPLVLNKADFRDKVYACWLGKNIGGTLGGPWECKKHANALTFFDPMPDKAAPNDDLDLQLVWLKMLEEVGLDPSVRHFADYWDRFAARYPWNEYGFFMRNYSRGLVPPVAGCFENYFVDEMGSPIRSEIWACIHPGDPQAAARMAWKDSAVDHAGGEGTYGEMFWAAVEAAAFVETDPMTLIRIGLNTIPLSSHLGRSIREAVWCYENGLNWGQARERIVTRFGHLQPCNAIPNHGFTIIGLLYGDDFGDKLCKAVNCGYDTDCTGATLGSLLGIMHGTAGIPQKWIKPIGTDIVLHKFTGDCDCPKNLEELTERTMKLAELSVAEKPHVSLGSETVVPADCLSRFFDNRQALEALEQDPQSAIELLDGQEICLHYGGEPVIRPGIAKTISITGQGLEDEKVAVTVPAGWDCAELGGNRFQVRAEGGIADVNKIQVKIGSKGTAEFAILGSEQAKGFPAGDNVTQCPKCHARIEACMC